MGIIHHLEKEKKLETEPEESSSEVDMWIDNDGLLTSWLLGLMTEEVLKMIVGVEAASQVWSSLKEQLLPMTKEKEVNLTDRLLSLKKGSSSLKNICRDSRHFVIDLPLSKSLLMT